MNRRKMLKSLAAIFGASCAPSLFIPKFEPVRWKVIKPLHVQFGDFFMEPHRFYGKWIFIEGEGMGGQTLQFIKPEPAVFEEVTLFVRDTLALKA